MFPLDLIFVSVLVCAELTIILPWHRSEGYLVLSGGLTVHTFQDWSAWKEDTAAPPYVAFHKALVQAVQISEVGLLSFSLSPSCAKMLETANTPPRGSDSSYRSPRIPPLPSSRGAFHANLHCCWRWRGGRYEGVGCYVRAGYCCFWN